jgi:hypothetical protein
VSLTVWGVASEINGISEERSILGKHVSAHSYRELSMELPPGGLEVDCDHDGVAIGEVVYAELSDGEPQRLRVVAVVDDRLESALRERSVYFSPLMEMVGDGVHERSYIARAGEVIGLSLTLETKRVGASPVEWRAGDVRDPVSRGSWPLSWAQTTLLERSSQVGRRERALRIVDLRPIDNPWGLREGQRVNPAEFRSRELPGGFRRGAPGRVLRVH